LSTEVPPSGRDPAASTKLQILATEHWSLLATRTLTYTESLSRVTIFLTILSGSVIALALVAQVSRFGPAFIAIAIPLLAVVVFTGISTIGRLMQLNGDDFRWVIGMNRLRHAYLELHPELEPYFITGHYDDLSGALQTIGYQLATGRRVGSVLHTMQVLPGMLSVIVASGTAGFGAPVFVDTVRAGGEPGILHSNKYGNLVYTSHEGTTHIDRSGGPASIQQFLCPGLTTADCYKNHVWIWTSDDHGKTWQLRDEALPYTGFSDPDLTQDASGSIYNTGIDLANDSVFSSQDGGKTWPHGTTNCHEGDRPWLAGGGAAGEVYMATDTEENGHEVFYSANYADSCSVTGIADTGSFNNGQESYSGFGKLVYDAFDGSLIEPAVFTHTDGTIGVDISRLPNARDAFNGGHETWQPQEVVYPTTVYSPFGAPELISMDSAENIYFAWDTNERDPNGTGGCSQLVPNTGGGPTPL